MEEMPLYICHKRVWALKIKDVVFTGDTAHLTFEGNSAPLTVSIADRPKPEPGWYYVVYENNYHSFSPAKAFEEGYTLASNSGTNTIGWAIKQMQNGARVRRAGWNGKGMWLAYSPGAQSLPAELFWAGPNREYAEKIGGVADVLPCITMKTATGEILMGWLASQSDLLATDWEIAS